MLSIMQGRVQIASNQIVVGTDTHKQTHTYSALSSVGGVLGTETFPATLIGHQKALTWARQFGDIAAFGIECAANYGAGLARFIRDQNIPVVEVNVVDKQARARAGKTDEYDSITAGRLLLSGQCQDEAKQLEGPFLAISVVLNARDSAVRMQTKANNQVKAALVRCADEYRAGFDGLTTLALHKKLANSRPRVTDSQYSVKNTLRLLSARYLFLKDEIKEHDKQLKELVVPLAPQLLECEGIGLVGAATILSVVGSNLTRINGRDGFCRLAGVSPKPVSSGMTDKHRLDRGGNRQLNKVLYTAAMTRSQKKDSATAVYIEKRLSSNKTRKDALRCLKKYIAREVYSVLLKVYEK